MKLGLFVLFSAAIFGGSRAKPDWMESKEKLRKELNPSFSRERAQEFTRLIRQKGEVVCEDGLAGGKWECNNMNLVSFLSIEEMQPEGLPKMANEVVGWTDHKGREYALVGLYSGTSVVDISNPKSPKVLGFIPSTEGAGDGTYFRDVKIVGEIAYISADFPARGHGIQVFDLARIEKLNRGVGNIALLEPDYVVPADINHNLVVAEEAKKLIGVGVRGYDEVCPKQGPGQPATLKIYNLENPFAPEFEDCVYLETGRVHDAQCAVYHGPDTRFSGNTICFLFGEATGDIVIYNLDTMEQINSFTYDTAAYTHQGVVSGDHAFLYVNDEEDETDGIVASATSYIFDISDLLAPVRFESTYMNPTSHPAVDHNMNIEGNFIYQAAYTAGARVLKIVEDGRGLEEIAYFDFETTCEVVDWSVCFPFQGAWTHLPMPSGITIASSVFEGFFILRPTF